MWPAATALSLAVAAVCAVAERPAAGAAPRIAAHRGGARLWPANSLLAFRGARGLGVDFVETDVPLPADGEPVVIHDPTLERTTTGAGAVRAARLADLAGGRPQGGGRAPAAGGPPAPAPPPRAP